MVRNNFVMFLVFAAVVVVQGDTLKFKKIPHACLPWLQPLLTQPSDSTISQIEQECLKTPLCNAFDSSGRLFSCPHGRCDCDGGLDTCLRGLDKPCSTEQDLYVSSLYPPPVEWATQIASGSLLYGSPEATECYVPEIGNGYLGTTVGWGAVFIAGLFNGACGTVRKARLPSPVAVSISNGILVAGALHTEDGMYTRIYLVGTESSEVRVTYYAHRTIQNVLVLEIDLVSTLQNNETQLEIQLTSLWAPNGNGVVPPDNHIPGDGCASSFTDDLSFYSASTPIPTGNATLYTAHTNILGDRGEVWNVSFVVQNIPKSVILHNNKRHLQYVHVITSTLDGSNAVDVYNKVMSMDPIILRETHKTAWKNLYTSRITVNPRGVDELERAQDIAQHIASSRYYLFSSISDTNRAGVSPGGVSSGSYNGAVFMDMDLWMQPTLYFTNPSLAKAMIEFRRVSTDKTDGGLARLFGYNGTMVAWTAAFEGRPFGCCDGKGGYEDCLEQHVTGAVAWSAWKYFSATGNMSWLEDAGWDVLSGSARFHASRVTKNADGSYSLKGVLPIDEWCVGSGCGCEMPGVDDDAETNAVAKLSLLYGAQAAKLLNRTSTETMLWEDISNKLPLLMNETGGHHNQFNSPSCPGGWGGTHYTPQHTVCPEDVMMLSYPFGEALSVPLNVTMKDSEIFIPRTCEENAGMTTPIHGIVHLLLGNRTAADAQLNRSMHAACYGPFNVRNEVDAHADIIGGHFNNTKFLTGDGGFLQLIVNGYCGLRVVDDAFLISGSNLPQALGSISLHNFVFRKCHFSLSINDVEINLSLLDDNVDAKNQQLSIIDARGVVITNLKPGDQITSPVVNISWPWRCVCV
eukprot:PhF_6_TR9183/c0_g1_i1/m.14325/K22078/PGGHG, ATHL1; protein-glucosylgalactosylhydroxylysine glucosidase